MSSSRKRLYHPLSLLLIAFCLTFIYQTRTEVIDSQHVVWQEKGDHHAYHYMAAHDPIDFHLAPYCWRLANPVLAKILPFDLLRNFQLLTFAGLWLTGPLLFVFLKRLSWDDPWAFCGMLWFYSMGWILKFEIYDFWLSDAQSYLWMTLALTAIASKQRSLYAISLLIGVSFRESVLFIAPLYYSLHAKKLWQPKLLKDSMLCALPAVIYLAAIRHAIPAMNHIAEYVFSKKDWLHYPTYHAVPYDLQLLFWDFVERRFSHFTWGDLHTWSTYAYGVPITLLSITGVLLKPKLWIRFSPFFFLGYGQLFLAANTERLLVILYPALILFSLHGLEWIAKTFAIKPGHMTWIPLLFLGLNLRNPQEITASFELQTAALVICFIIFFLYRRLQLCASDEASGTLPK